MARHHVDFAVPQRPLGNADIEFAVFREGARFGTLRVSKGAVVWTPANAKRSFRLAWAQLSDLAVRFGSEKGPVRPRRTGPLVAR